MNLQVWQLILDKALSWQVVTLIGMLLFKKSFSGLISRISKLGAGKDGLTVETKQVEAAVIQQMAAGKTKAAIGLLETTTEITYGVDASVAAGRTAAAAAQPRQIDPDAVKRVQDLRDFALSPILQEQINAIVKDMVAANVAQQEQIELLTKALGITQLSYGAEYIYRTILGSQLDFLNHLNTGGGMTMAEVGQGYAELKKTFPQMYNAYSLTDYLNYMVSNGLTTVQGDKYVITPAGKEFLKWIVDNGIIPNKPF